MQAVGSPVPTQLQMVGQKKHAEDEGHDRGKLPNVGRLMENEPRKE